MTVEIKANQAAKYIRISLGTEIRANALKAILRLLGIPMDPWGLGKTDSKTSVYLPYTLEKEEV